MHITGNLRIARFVFSNMGDEIPAKKQHFSPPDFFAPSLVTGTKNEAAKYLSKRRLYSFFRYGFQRFYVR